MGEKSSGDDKGTARTGNLLDYALAQEVKQAKNFSHDLNLLEDLEPISNDMRNGQSTGKA